MASGIYQILNVISKKRYVGSSKDISNRRKEHFWSLRLGKHKNKHLQNSFNKYGESAFEYSLIELCQIDLLEDREQYWMDYYGFDNLYNSRPLAFSNKSAKPNSGSFKKGNSPKNKGVPMSSETKKRVSEARKGKGFHNRTMSAEARNKMSLAKKGKPRGYITRENLYVDPTGTIHTFNDLVYLFKVAKTTIWLWEKKKDVRLSHHNRVI